MEASNPFKQLESDAICPPRLKAEIISEIDLIRNATTVVDVYIGDLFNLLSVLASPPHIPTPNSQTEL